MAKGKPRQMGFGEVGGLFGPTCYCCGGRAQREEPAGVGVLTLDLCGPCTGARIRHQDTKVSGRDQVWLLDCPAHGPAVIGHEEPEATR